MHAPAILLAVAALAGAVAGIDDRVSAPACATVACVALPGVLFALTCGRRCLATLCLVAGLVAATGALAADARTHALHTRLRSLVGGGAGRGPVLSRLTLTEDASSATNGLATVRGDIRQVFVGGKWTDADGGVVVRVSGTAAGWRRSAWTRGRTIEAPVSYAQPFHVFDRGVPDFERQAALDGITLLGSVKSGFMVDVVARGSPVEEWASRVRAGIRRRVQRYVGQHAPLSAAIVTAVLIGDRSALPPEIRERLQAAGTYHVIAISGGNVVLFAGIVVGVLTLTGWSPRVTSIVAALGLLAHAAVVAPGSSVERATVVAVAYFVARALELSTSPWQVLSVAVICVVVTSPLDVSDAGFVFTFGATAALLTVIPWTTTWRAHWAVRWAIASVVSSLAVDAVLLPASAALLSRVSVAGPVLNLLAVPLMGVVQVAGMVTALPQPVDGLARVSGVVAHMAASGIVESARVVDMWPRLSVRLPAPDPAVLVAYYSGLVGFVVAWRHLRLRTVAWTCAAVVAGAGTLLVLRVPAVVEPPRAGHLRLTAFDVGQGDALLLERPDGGAVLVDTGGSPFDDAGTNVGRRVIEPALWARGLRRVETLVVTHGDPDHVGGASAIVTDMTPSEFWMGIDVAAPTAADRALEAAHTWRVPIRHVRAGEVMHWGHLAVRVLNPPPPDWERRRVRNDDSVVLEVRYGDVAVLLTGDIGADVERAIVPELGSAPIRVLKVAHHGSRTSSSAELVEAWRPQIGVVSAGRNNPFGHPTPEVMARLAANGVRVFRTDQDGEVTLDTDGRSVTVTTYSGARFTCCQRASSSSSVASWR